MGMWTGGQIDGLADRWADWRGVTNSSKRASAVGTPHCVTGAGNGHDSDNAALRGEEGQITGWLHCQVQGVGGVRSNSAGDRLIQFQGPIPRIREPRFQATSTPWAPDTNNQETCPDSAGIQNTALCIQNRYLSGAQHSRAATTTRPIPEVRTQRAQRPRHTRAQSGFVLLNRPGTSPTPPILVNPRSSILLVPIPVPLRLIFLSPSESEPHARVASQRRLCARQCAVPIPYMLHRSSAARQ